MAHAPAPTVSVPFPLTLASCWTVGGGGGAPCESNIRYQLLTNHRERYKKISVVNPHELLMIWYDIMIRDKLSSLIWPCVEYQNISVVIEGGWVGAGEYVWLLFPFFRYADQSSTLITDHRTQDHLTPICSAFSPSRALALSTPPYKLA